ncbi:MAG: hypothetical protein WCX88_02325 [Patescibacteria group bacterium]
MPKKSIVIAIIAFAVLLTGCTLFVKKQTSQPKVQPIVQSSLTEFEAQTIAEKTCIKGGETLSPGYYNEITKTWWFDANLNATKEGCNPACVVFEDTKLAEINWRCTGLITPTITTSDAIKNIFVAKYSKYAKTLTVHVDQEAQNHARGGVSFEAGAPGAIFLATKINDEWKIVFEGNGQISCYLSEYEFPAEMLTDCAK